MKKFTAILSAAILVLSFISCGTNSNPNNETDPNNKETVETTVAPEFIPLEGANYGGYEFRIFGTADKSVILGQFGVGLINEIAPKEETGEIINDAVFMRNREVEELYNIKIKPVCPDVDRNALAQAAIKPILAGDDEYDMALYLGSNLPIILGSNGYTYDLFTVPNLDLSNSWWNQASIKWLSLAKQIHIVTGDISVFSMVGGPYPIFQNKALVDDYKLENAYDLVRNGTWTCEKLIEMCRIVAHDLNGDGIMDENDLFGVSGEHVFIRAMVEGSGERFTKKDAGDIPYLAVNTERTVQALEYAMNSVLDKSFGLYCNEYLRKFPDIGGFIVSKFTSNEILFSSYPLTFTFELRDMEADFAILPYPKLAENQSDYYTSVSTWYSSFVFIPATNTDIPRTGAVVEALGYYSQKYVRPQAIDVTVTNKLIRDDDSADMLNIIFNTRSYDLAIIYAWGGFVDNMLYNSVNTRSNTFASNYAKHETNVITAMEKTINDIL
ncbi:MAG: hypothetical protein FWF15_04300, partial [Oscillospiraceae bacterium]|nr:hypothetical protein [Oscillospiraceae bacterium]